MENQAWWNLRNLMKDAWRVRFRDWSDYDSRFCNNGGSYMFGLRFDHIGHNAWLIHETTSGEFCPYCRSFDCPGDCRDARRADHTVLSDEDVQKALLKCVFLMNQDPENYEVIVECD